MPVSMVDVGVMGTSMNEPLVPVGMRMWLSGRIVRRMLVPVVLVVNVEMIVCHRFMNMRVLMALGYVEPNTGKHENARRAKSPIQLPLPDGKGERSSGKRGDRKIGPCTRGAEIPKSPHKKRKAQAVAEKADDRRTEYHAGGGHF